MTIKISQLANLLKAGQKQVGDIEVMISSDTEGNSFSTLNAGDIFGVGKKDGKQVLVIYPYEEHLQLDWED